MNLIERIHKHQVITQLKFGKAIAMAWVNPDSIAATSESVQTRKIYTKINTDATVATSTSSITMDVVII